MMNENGERTAHDDVYFATKASTPRVEYGGLVFDADVSEISGFGGSYEEACRTMVMAGYLHLRASGAKPVFRGYEGIVGVLSEENGDARELTRVMMDARLPSTGRRIGDDCTGAMHQFSAMNAMLAAKMEWGAYCDYRRRIRAEGFDDE